MNVLCRKTTVIIIIYYLFIFKYLKQNFDDSAICSTLWLMQQCITQFDLQNNAKVERNYTNLKQIGNFLRLHSTFVLFVAGKIYAIVNFSYDFCDICKVMSLDVKNNPNIGSNDTFSHCRNANALTSYRQFGHVTKSL